MGCRGLDWQEGAAVVCESAGIQLPDTSLDLLFLGLTGASYPGSLLVACVQSPAPFLLVTHSLFSPLFSQDPRLGPAPPCLVL